MPSHPDIYQFSKNSAAGERSDAAKRIHEKRTEYFSRQKNINEQTVVTEKERLAREKNIQLIADQLTKLDGLIAERENTLLSKIFHFLEIKKAKEQSRELTGQQQIAADELREITDVITQLNEQRLNHHELQEATAVLGDFWQDQFRAWEKFERDKKVSDVENVCRENDCVLVHAIHPNFIPGANSPLELDASWQDKLEIMAALEPTVSASSVHKGDNADRNLFAKMGVVLSGGHIEGAGAVDQATVARERQKREHYNNELPIYDQINSAIHDRHPDAYNEFIVQNPKIAGFFVSFDENDAVERGANSARNSSEKIAPINEIREMTKKIGLPLFILEGGEFYRTETNDNTNISKGEPINNAELLNQQVELNADQKLTIVERVFQEMPIKKEILAREEAALIDSHLYGREQYFKLLGLQIIEGKIDAENFPLTPYKNDGSDKDERHAATRTSSNGIRGAETIIPAGQPVRFLGEIQVGQEKLQYLADSNHVYSRHQDRRGAITVSRINDSDVGSGHIFVADSYYGGGSLTLPENIKNSDDYLSQVEKQIEQTKQWFDNMKKDFGAHSVDEHKFNIDKDNLSFHLYGFGHEAMRHGDSETAMKAIGLASRYVPRERYDDIIKRRVGEDGAFKIDLAEDLGIK